MAVKTVFFLYLFCLWLQVQARQGVVLTSSGEPCFGRTVTLTCTHPDPLQDPAMYQPLLISFIENGQVLNFADPDTTTRRFTPARLNSTASTLSFNVTKEDHANKVVTCSCFLVFNGGGREESNTINMDVNETIHAPTLVSKPNRTSGLLQWNSPSSTCSNYQYNYTLTWVRIGDSSMYTVSTAKTWHNLTGGNYTATVTAKIVGLNLDESEPLNVPFFMTPNMTAPPSTTTGPPPVCIVCIAVPPGVVIPLLCLLILIVLSMYYLCRNRQKRVSHSHSADPVPSLQEYSEAPFKKQEAEDVELGQTRQELDKKQEAENDQIQYAAIDFSGQRPIAPPSLETVVYTETVEQFRKARKNRPIPPLPPVKTEEEEEEERKLAQEAAEITADFKAQVVAILQASKLVYRSLDPEEPVVGTYQKKTFVANFVHAPGGKEILSSEVEAIIKDRELQSTDKGFLVATTDSISGPWLEYLEKHNCHFIGLSCKGGVKKEMLLKKLSFCFPESSSF